MTLPQKQIVDCLTGESEFRDLNKTELEFVENYQAEKKKLEKEKLALGEAQQTILDRLGLTAEEFKTLLGQS